MSLASWLGFTPKTPAPQVYLTQTIDFHNILGWVLDQPIDRLWREQPHLRTVVGFIARNIAQLGWHVFERDEQDGRNRLRDTPLALLLNMPNGQDTAYDLVYATVASMCLYDQSYWYVGTDLNAPSGWSIRHIPTPWIIGTNGSSVFAVDSYKVAMPNTGGGFVEIPADDMVVFHGWNPLDPLTGTSPVLALKTILAEQIHAQVYRDQTWQRGGRVGSYLTRPSGVEWSPEARNRFMEQWADQYAGDKAPKAGGTPLLEDGMELKSNRFSAKDEQYVEGNRLSLETCAQVFYINPTMIGVLDNANYSNVREFRRALYGDTLGAPITQLEQRINRDVVPRLADASKVYVEFNLQSKLAGSFEEQASVMQTAIGAPWLTINEGRAKQNLPALPGGDELVRPLNVTANGSQNPIPAEPAPPPPQPKGGHTNGTERRRGDYVFR